MQASTGTAAAAALPESPATSGYIPIAEIAPYLSRQGRGGAGGAS